MRKNMFYKILGLISALGFINAGDLAAQDSTRNELILTVSYFMHNNKVMYLQVNSKTKIEKKFQPVPNASIKLYLDKEEDSLFIGKLVTNEKGFAKAIFPVSLQSAWAESATHIILGIAEGSKDFDEVTSEISVIKSRMEMDTSSSDGVKTISVKVLAQSGGEWRPAPDVEMKLGIKRLGGILSAGDEETYTTDSTGIVTVELKKDSLPGDEKGNLVLVAKVEDNDQYGNLDLEKIVPWGVPVIADKKFFDQRTLWSTRFRTPFWLLLMAYSIAIGVWSVLIYLVFQIIKIKKLSLSEKA